MISASATISADKAGQLNLEFMQIKERQSSSVFNRAVDRCYLRYAPVPLQHWYEKIRFRRVHGYWPDILRPKSFSERICAKKLFDRDPLLVETTDKIRFRDYITRVLGSQLARQVLVEQIHVFRSIEDLKSVEMPTRGIIKPTHSSGRFILFSEDEPLDFGILYKLATRWLSHIHGARSHEWAYSQLEPGLVLEERMGEPRSIPIDFKFFVFSGRCRLIQVDQGRLGDHRRLLYDTDWNLLDVKYHKPVGQPQNPPRGLAEMMMIAEMVGRPFAFSRVDFYYLDYEIKIGEITHYPEGAFGSFEPKSFDFYLGEVWDECQNTILRK